MSVGFNERVSRMDNRELLCHICAGKLSQF